MNKRVIASMLSALLMLVTLPVWSKDFRSPFVPADAPPAIDYSQTNSWLALPADPNAYDVDVFWVYPTVFHKKTGWLMDIRDKELQQAAQRTLRYQASVFSQQANVYAPLYRQMNMAGLSLPEDQKDRLMQYPKEDVWHALQYYLKHYNRGRPFILAAHSQGSIC